MRARLTIAWALLLLAFAATAAEPGAPDPRSPVGRWKTIDDETEKPRAIVEIREEGGRLVGTIVRIFPEPGEDPNPRCTECEGKLKDRPIVGMTILRGLERDGDEWSGGTILDPENGETYDCELEVMDGGKRLKVRGYLGISLLGRTQYWLRAE